MAKRIAGVTEKLMEAAKQEFLKNGYERASLQAIAEKAGSSKGAIYIRYPDKESLYRSLVQPAMDDFCSLIQSALEQFNQLPGAEQTSHMYSFSDHGFWASVDYIYDHFDEFKLLLTSGENSPPPSRGNRQSMYHALYSGIWERRNLQRPPYTRVEPSTVQRLLYWDVRGGHP